MEGRLTRKYGYGSPERARPRWVVGNQQPPPKQQQRSSPPQQQEQQPLQPGTKVPVVYYLCRNRHLEHPHFIEVPLSSQEGLFLRDVINRLNVLRGKGMASSYSWSCKRSYKSGFVWHDLSEDDLIVPANGNEYILKGSELFDSSASDGYHHSNGAAPKQEPSTGQDSPPTSSCVAVSQVHTMAPSLVQEEELSPSAHRTSSSSGNTSNSSLGSDISLRLAENKVWKPSKAADASTQTDEKSAEQRRAQGNISVVNFDEADRDRNQGSRLKESSEICTNEISPPPSSSSTPSSNGKVETLESLIRAEARKMNSFRILEEDDVLMSSRSKLKATNVIMQLITCGSTTVKDHQSFGLVHTYKPRFSNVKFPSLALGNPMVLGERDCIPENPKILGLRTEEKCFNGSILETKKHGKEEGKVVPILSHSSSFEDDRNCKLPDPAANKDRTVNSLCSKGLRQTVKLASGRQVTCETLRSPALNGRSASFSANSDHSLSTVSISMPNGSSMRSVDVSSEKGPSSRLESFKENNKIVKIEERLPSGARIIIQSRGACDDSEDGIGP